MLPSDFVHSFWGQHAWKSPGNGKMRKKRLLRLSWILAWCCQLLIHSFDSSIQAWQVTVEELRSRSRIVPIINKSRENKDRNRAWSYCGLLSFLCSFRPYDNCISGVEASHPSTQMYMPWNLLVSAGAAISGASHFASTAKALEEEGISKAQRLQALPTAVRLFAHLAIMKIGTLFHVIYGTLCCQKFVSHQILTQLTGDCQYAIKFAMTFDTFGL